MQKSVSQTGLQQCLQLHRAIMSTAAKAVVPNASFRACTYYTTHAAQISDTTELSDNSVLPKEQTNINMSAAAIESSASSVQDNMKVTKGQKLQQHHNVVNKDISDDIEVVKSFLEYCLSDVNIAQMSTGRVAKGKVPSYGYISVSELLTMDPLKDTGVTQELAIAAARLSEHLQVSDDDKSIRRLDPIIQIDDSTSHLVDWNSYFHSISKQSELIEALKVFFNLRTLPPQQVLNAAVLRAANLGSVDLAEKIIQGLAVRGQQPHPSIIMNLAVAYAINGDQERAYATLEDIITKGVKPSSNIWTKFINSVAEQGGIEQAMVLLELMKKCGVQPDAVTFNVLMRSCGVNDSKQLKLLLNEMENAGIANTVSYNCVLRSHKNTGNIEEAKQMIESMKERGIRISDESYTLYLQTVCKTGDMEFAVKVLKDIDDAGIMRSRQMLDALLFCCYLDNNLEDMQRYAKDILTMGEKWSRSNYICMLSLARKKDLKFCEEIFESMKAETGKVKPDLMSHNLMIFAYAKKMQYDKAKNIEAQMIASGIQPDATTYSGLVYACGLTNGLDAAIELLEQYKVEKNQAIDNYMLNMLLNICRLKEDLDKAMLFFKENFYLDNKECKADRVTFGTLLSGYSKFNQIDKMFEISDMMHNAGIKHDEITLSSMLNGVKDNESVTRVCELIVDQGFNLDDIKFREIRQQKRTRLRPNSPDDPTNLLDTLSANAMSDQETKTI